MYLTHKDSGYYVYMGKTFVDGWCGAPDQSDIKYFYDFVRRKGGIGDGPDFIMVYESDGLDWEKGQEGFSRWIGDLPGTRVVMKDPNDGGASEAYKRALESELKRLREQNIKLLEKANGDREKESTEKENRWQSWWRSLRKARQG
jgi:hypothetical protein